MKRKITSNVLEDVARRIRGEGNLKGKKRALVVLNGSNVELDKKIQLIRDMKTQGVQISLAFSFMAEKLLDKKQIINSLCPMEIYGEEDVFRLKDISMEYDFIIAPNITVNTLSKVSLGMIDSFISTLIWTFLYKGKKVYIDFNSVRKYLGEEAKNNTMSTLIENNISTIKEMGAIEIDGYSYVEKIGQLSNGEINSNTDHLQTSTNMETNNKKVITERDILNLSTKNLRLSKGTIVTPLARDRAREMNISIEII